MLKNRLYFDLFEKRTVPNFFDQVSYIGLEDKQDDPIEIVQGPANDSFMLKIHFVPEYLKFNLNPPYKVLASKHVPGFAVELDGVNNLEEYIIGNLKPRLRTSVRNKPKKLEESREISYHWHYGDMEKETYNRLMERVREMLISRFEELEKTNERITEWERLLPIIFPLILEKKASIFEVRDGDNPIAISVNYHIDSIFCLFIPAIDPEYSKYGLGHLLISKQLDWCFRNNYKLMDFMMGDLRYKRDWCNRVYDFETWVVYDNTKLNSQIRAYFTHWLQQLKMYLKSKGVHLWYQKFRQVFGLNRRKIRKKNRLNY